MEFLIHKNKIHIFYLSAQKEAKYWQKICSTGRVEEVSDPISAQSIINSSEENLKFWNDLLEHLEKSMSEPDSGLKISKI